MRPSYRHPIGAPVLVNGVTPGTVLDREEHSGEYTQRRRPFATYLVSYDGGILEWFTGAYLRPVPATVAL